MLSYSKIEKIPEFPISALPKNISNYVQALSDATQTTRDMAGVLSLGVLATSLQNRYFVQLDQEWIEPLCLYTVASAPVGERKGAVLKALTGVVFEYQSEKATRESRCVAVGNANRRIAINEAKKSGSQFTMEERMREIDEKFPEMHHFRITVDDITEEALADDMRQQGGSISVVSSGCKVFDLWAGKYRNHADFGVAIKAYSGIPIQVDRSSRCSFRIENPRLSMVLAMTPYELQQIIENRDFMLRGLCGKMIFAVCESMSGRRNCDPPPVKSQIRDSYRSEVARLLSGKDKGAIHISEDAIQEFRAYQLNVEKRLGPSGDLGHMTDWGCHLVGTMIRIAGIIHAVESDRPTVEQIGAETIKRAVLISDCLSEHAKTAYSLAGIYGMEKSALC